MKHDDDEDTQNANHKLGKIFSLHILVSFFSPSSTEREKITLLDFFFLLSSTLLLSLCNVEGEERLGGKRYIYVFCSFVTK